MKTADIEVPDGVDPRLLDRCAFALRDKHVYPGGYGASYPLDDARALAATVIREYQRATLAQAADQAQRFR